ncbi:MAG: type II secretion system protein [Planctomycetes bacterium]|nr:type II secretion system protein [Planctomycetota bacterium]
MSPQPDQHYGPKLRGFTIVELMIVIAVIILLLSIVIVAVNAATRTAQSANTLTLMNSMKQALVRFKADIGYYPPVFGPGSEPVERLRELFPWPDPASPASYQVRIQNWWSSAAMAEYLLGYDEGGYDGYGLGPDSPGYIGETPTLGIRHPGPDGVWGAVTNPSPPPGDGSLGARNPPLDGKVYGPYLELKDERLLGSTDGSIDQASGNPRVFFPGDGNYNPDHPKIIVDYWGNPIRYYRKVYPAGALQSVYRSTDPAVPSPTLADVFVLRPFDLKPGSAIDGIADNSLIVPGGDTTTTHALRTAEFALVSAGPDRALDATTRYDAPDQNGNDPDGDGISFENKDNIVELGP